MDLFDKNSRMNMPTQSIPSTLLVDFSSPQNLDDEALAAWLDQRYRAGCAVGYLHADYVCKVVDLDSLASPLHPADPEKKSKTLLKKLARGGLLKQLVLPQDTLNTVDTVDSGWRWIPVTQDEILILLNSRQMMLGREAGRGAAISTKTAQKVWADAGGRCMYEGCGEDLTSIALHTKPTRVGYLAHIIASDPSGPRGSLDDSHRLSNNADNIMLMCDAHHRLIDSFAPIDHPADRLFAMRQKHRDLVRFYLNALAYPRSRAVTLHANLAHVPTHFHESELIDAILATGRAMLPDVVHYIRRYQRDDRRTPDFWYHYLQEHELEISQQF